MTQGENQDHSGVPGAGGFSPAPRFHTDCRENTNVVHRKTSKESQQIKYLPDKIIGRSAENPPYAVCHLTMSINQGDWL